MRRGPLLVVASSSAALACSGEGARELMFRSTLAGWAGLALSVAATLVSVRLSRQRSGAWRKAATVLSVGLVLVHPGLWVGVTSGDCGATRLLLAPLVALIHLAIVVPSIIAK